ncbi:hypothetical protein [Vibrio ulleungensis]|uniref:WD40 repeat protein n=1 Tax=Vibrio ulleungensis TaxID=2807619 RepID=A0ABS2HHZ5_9VIBR|nr:hypothetical protein [Vibrio ulleungensis]MBM7035783.1 hypothetical protein [Vibrio ulleungensis]
MHRAFNAFFISIVLTLVSFSSAAENNRNTFDYPFLLGDWYLLNPNVDNGNDDFRTIRLSFTSNFDFLIQIQKRDYSVDQWSGSYSVGDEAIVLGLNTDVPQYYEYKISHNRLLLNGITFYKLLNKEMAGIWTSESLSGEDLLASNVSKMDLVLQPDFVFLFRSSNDSGAQSVHHGVYYIENDQLILLYENGEHESTFTLQDDQLTLEGEESDMFAVLNRVK